MERVLRPLIGPPLQAPFLEKVRNFNKASEWTSSNQTICIPSKCCLALVTRMATALFCCSLFNDISSSTQGLLASFGVLGVGLDGRLYSIS